MNKKRTIVVALAFLMLVSVIVLGAAPAEDVDDEDENDTDGYIVRDPIRIDGNDDFAAQAAAEGWPGDGSEGDPYVIEGYEIDGTGYGYGIYVGNTTVYFIVRNCYVHNASGYDWSGYNGIPTQIGVLNSGIILLNVENGVLTNNTLADNYRAINFRRSENNLISKNTLSSNVFGISSADSRYNIVSFNDINGSSSSGGAIWLQGCDYNILSNNTMSNYRIGILGINSFDNEIENNMFSNVETEIEFIEMVENGNETNGDKIPTSVFAFFVIVVLVVITVIWKKKDKIKELKK